MKLRINRIAKYLSLIALASFLHACALWPRDHLPEPKLLDVGGLEKNVQEAAPVIQKDWWLAFGDENLNKLMDKALKGSPSLTAADARMKSAQALYEANRATLIPQIGAGAQISRQQLSQNYIFIPGVMDPYVSYGMIGGSLQWSLDLWGKQKKLMSAAGKRFDGAKASYEAARLNLASTLVNVYIDYDRAVKSYEFAKRDAHARKILFEIAEARSKAGIIDTIGLEQKRIDWTAAQVREGQAELAVKQFQHQLAVLAAEGPSWGEQLPAPQLSATKLTSVFPDKIPADLLARRPDLQALLSQVEASRIEVGAAKLDYLPNFDLQGNFGFQSYGISNLLTLPSQMFGIGPVMSLPIFDGGRIDANVAAKEAGRNQAIADYHDGLLHALKQSADGIAGFKNAKNDLNHLEDGAKSMRKINDAFIERGNRGIVSKEQIEISETNLLKQEQALADGQARLFAAHVGLIQALGGGYSQVDVKNK